MVDPDAQRVEHVGRAGPRGHRPVAVLGDRHAGGRDDEGRGRRDVERVGCRRRPCRRCRSCRPVRRPAGRARASPRANPVSSSIVSPRIRRATSRAAELGRRRLAVHHGAHRRPRLVAAEHAPVDDGGQGRPHRLAHRAAPGRLRQRRRRLALRQLVGEPLRAQTTRRRRRARPPRPRPASRRKFASRCGPSGVSTDSGWNWTPSIGSDVCRTPIRTSSPALSAVATSPGGRQRRVDLHSEW